MRHIEGAVFCDGWREKQVRRTITCVEKAVERQISDRYNPPMARNVIAGRYRILRELGKGGTAAVYLAEDRKLQKVWAVKILPRTACGTELALLKKLDYPAIPRVVDVVETEADVCLVMDYMEGPSLEQILRQRGRQSEGTVRAWGMQICDILIYLHS